MDIKKKLHSTKNILILIAIIIVFSGAVSFISYYFLFYIKPNFNDENFNYIKAVSLQQTKPGDEIQIELSYKNTGYREVKDLTVEFFVPQYTKFKISNQTGKYFEDKNSIVFEGKSLKRNEGKKILITLIVDKPADNGTFIKFSDAQINYNVSGEAGKSLTTRIKSTASFEIKSSPKVSMSNLIIKDLNGGYINMGDEINYSFNVINSGDMNATGIEISALIPLKTDIIKGSIQPDNYKIDGNEIIWKLDNFGINKPVDFSFNLKVLTGFTDMEKIAEKVSLKSDQGDFLTSKTTAEVRLFPDLGNSTITVTDENGDYIWAGDKVLLKASLINDGEKSAEKVRFTCPVPKNTIYIKNSAKCDGASISVENNTLLFEIDKIDVNENKEASFELQISPQMTNGGIVKTDFNLSSNGTDFKFPVAEIKVKANYKVTVACLGDSLIALSNWPQIINSLLESTYIHSDYSVIASGIKGEMASGGFSRFDSTIAKYRPQIVIIGYGTNDIGSGTDRFSYYLSGIVQKAKNINATVFLESLGYIDTNKAPEKSDWKDYQRIIYQVGASYGVPVIDIYTPLSQNPEAYLTDWVHYTSEGSSVVAHTIFHYLVQYLDSNGVRR